jgi:drug/metabolite transporter (DMT)-like permease
MTKQIKGSLSIIAAAFVYGAYGIFLRLIGKTFQAFTQNWIKSLIIILILITYFLINRKHWHKLTNKNIKWLIIWMLTGSSVLVLLFFAFNNLALGAAYFIFYSTMLLGGYLSGKFLFGEKINKTKLISIVLVGLGLTLVYYSEISSSNLLYIILALIAGLCSGAWNSLSKKISNTYSNLQITFFDGVGNLIISLIGGLIAGESIPVLEFNLSWLWLLIFAIAQIAAISFLVQGFKHLEAQVATIILPIEVVFATIFGYIFFGEVLTSTTLLGGLLIVSATVLPSATFIYQQKKKKTT